MFFVEKITNKKARDFTLIHWAPTIIIFLAFMGVTLLAWHLANVRAAEERQAELVENVNQTSAEIVDQVNTSEAILRSGSGLIKASGEVSRADWKAYTDSVDFKNKYPAVNSIGFAPTVLNQNKDAFVAQVRQNDIPNFSIKPPGTRDVYVPVLYAETRDNDNSIPESIGQDLYEDPDRRAALNQAAETGESAMTGRVFSLAPQSGRPDQSVMIMYYPVFMSPNETGSVKETSGFMFMGARPDALFNAVLRDADRENYGYRIYFGEPSVENILYESPNFSSISSTPNALNQTRTLRLQNIDWTIEVNSMESAGTPEIQDRPTLILMFGTLVSFFMAAFVYILLLSRTRAIAYKEDIEIQNAKDELLALASHQLRTPATGVKQYVGMLREGYVGDLTAEQKELLNKAYDSNERQLNTINEMLSVARADAGRLPINKTYVDLNKMIKDILAEQKSSFDTRLQTLSTHLPKTALHANVDEQYFRMAIENIINNASKYTPERGAIDITMKQSKNHILIDIDDTGVGIPERHYPLMFKKFSRIPNDLTNQVSGTGIGLYLAKHIVEAHRGSLTFSSEAGVGSTFKISIPVAKKPAKES